MLLFHRFLTDYESDAFIRHGIGRYTKSLTVGMREDGTIGDVPNLARTSAHTWCMETQCLDDPHVQAVTDRVAEVTRFPTTNFEYAQLVHYSACTDETAPDCAFYKPHSDFISSSATKRPGPRVFTLFAYLNTVPRGGETRFPQLNVTVKAERGKALLWPSVLSDDPQSEDIRLTHEALSVFEGEKFGANFWLHLRDFREAHGRGCT